MSLWRYKLKALIVTIRDNAFNYGNKLQNFAVKKILERYNYKVETLCFERAKKNDTLRYAKYLFHKCTNYIFAKRKEYWLEYAVFRKFDSKNIPAVYIQNPNDIKGYDLYVIGSDQVWNAKWYHYKPIRKDFYLLNFDKQVKKLCMAPSFGINELPKEWVSWFKDMLPTFTHISVREEKGAEIVKKLTGQDATVMVDPTMLLTQDEWKQIAKKPRNINVSNGYILTYFLGGRNQQVESDLKAISEKHNLKIFNLMDENSPELCEIGPSEFIYMISNASLIMTDSFHASVFSFLFEKPFLVYPRSGAEDDMLSRLYTLINKFGLEDRFVETEIPKDIFACNYKMGYEKLEIERNKAREFIEMSLKD